MMNSHLEAKREREREKESNDCCFGAAQKRLAEKEEKQKKKERELEPFSCCCLFVKPMRDNSKMN